MWRRWNLIFVTFGFKFFLQVNLGTLLGGMVGLWWSGEKIGDLPSASPRRRALLGELGWSFEVRVAEWMRRPGR
jgi:hypothetical protein